MKKILFCLILIIFVIFPPNIIAAYISVNNADTAANWVSSDTASTVVSQETTLKKQGTGSVKVQTSAEVANTNIDLMEYSSDILAQTAYIGGQEKQNTEGSTVTATGGNTVADIGGFRIHTFTSDGTFTPNGTRNVEVLVVGGGGGGGGTIGGGGGGGGLVYNTSFAVTAQAYGVTVGPGGGGGASGGAGTKGGNSVFSSITALGGGGGAGWDAGSGTTGGSGGGNSLSYTGGPHTVGQGNDGAGGGSNLGGGGGGAGAAGVGGNGGSGVTYLISGSSNFYAGGGGAGARSGSATGGSGVHGGGNGATTGVGGNGTANTGGGGGGGSYDGTYRSGGNGGSGIVIIRYPLPSVFPLGGTVTDNGIFRLHTYTVATSDVFSPNYSLDTEVLVVGGGGGGGGTIGGGGGGGSLVYNSSLAVTAQAYGVTVGPGGGGGGGGGAGTKGSNSVFSSITALGGAGGAGWDASASETGGSGGGNSDNYTGGPHTVGQGSDGGGGGYNLGGGGGGGGAIGVAFSSGGHGGAGLPSSISGSTAYYSGGGGGGARSGSATAGSGVHGGGNGATTGVGGNGTANTGGGGGGGSYDGTYRSGGNGGSGIVIIRYSRATSYLKAYSEGTIKTEGSYSLKGVATATTSLNNTLTKTITSPIDLSNKTVLTFDMRSTRTGSNIKLGFHDSGGTTTEITPNISQANTFQTVTLDLSGVTNANKDAIDQIIITAVNADADNTFYLDNIFSPALGSLNDTVTFTTNAINLSSSSTLSYWVRSSVTGSFARFQFGEGASTEQTNAITINSADTWERKVWDISGIAGSSRDAVTKFAFQFTSNTSGATFYFDDINNAPTECTSIPLSGNHSISSACAFPGVINGVDAGTGTANTAKLTLSTGASLSILSDQTIAVGSLELSGGSITIIDGGSIKVGNPIYITDADGDGFPGSNTTTQYLSAGTNRARRSATADCNDAVFKADNVCCKANGNACSSDTGDGNGPCCSSICGTNADGDSYFSSSAGHTGSCQASALPYTDCNDGDGSYYPGNGGWYNDSGDHNCSGGIEKEYPDFYCSTCNSGKGRQSDNDGIDGGTGCGNSGRWWRTLNWGCWTPSTTCPAQTNSSVTQRCH